MLTVKYFVVALATHLLSFLHLSTIVDIVKHVPTSFATSAVGMVKTNPNTSNCASGKSSSDKETTCLSNENKEECKKYTKEESITFTVVKTHKSAKGDAYYTYGNWQMPVKRAGKKDSVIKGNYVSIKYKQPDGSWKFVFDAGKNLPKI